MLTLARVYTLASDQLLAPAVRDVITARLNGLSQPALAVLDAAAVIAHRCSFAQLRQVSGLDEQYSLDALDELLSAGMMVENRSHGLPYVITHQLMGRVVYARLSAARQQAFHRRAMHTLAGAQASCAELARHAQAAEEWQLAFDYSLKAGDEALRVCASQTAVCHFQAARALLNEKKSAADTTICQVLYTHLGQALEMESLPGEALAVYDEMTALAAVCGSREMTQAAQTARLATLHGDQGE